MTDPIPRTMRAMVLEAPARPLRMRELPVPAPGPGQVLIRVAACGVCRTDLHIADGELTHPKLPLVPGHEIVGRVAGTGPGASRYRVGDRVGVPWLGWTDGDCPWCRRGQENLCDRARFTGYDIDGGYAEYTAADERYCFPIPALDLREWVPEQHELHDAHYDDLHAAPLLCAGLIGYRAWRMAGEGEGPVGFYGFGASAHILIQIASAQGRKIFAFTRPGDLAGQKFALDLGAAWAGDSTGAPPEPLDAAIIFAPAGGLVPAALAATAKGGTVVCAGIHMSDIPSFPYRLLWEERVVRSVANLTRRDGEELMALATRFPIHTSVRAFPLAQANEALDLLRAGKIEGAAVLDCG